MGTVLVFDNPKKRTVPVFLAAALWICPLHAVFAEEQQATPAWQDNPESFLTAAGGCDAFPFEGGANPASDRCLRAANRDLQCRASDGTEYDVSSSGNCDTASDPKCPDGKCISPEGPERTVNLIFGDAGDFILALIGDLNAVNAQLAGFTGVHCAEGGCRPKVTCEESGIAIQASDATGVCPPEEGSGACVEFNISKTAVDEGGWLNKGDCDDAEAACADAIASALAGLDDPCPGCKFLTKLTTASSTCQVQGDNAKATCSASGTACCTFDEGGLTFSGQASGHKCVKCAQKGPVTTSSGGATPRGPVTTPPGDGPTTPPGGGGHGGFGDGELRDASGVWK